MPWYFDPQSGGIKIPVKLFETIRKRAETFEQTRTWYPKRKLSLRFKGQFCYVDVLEAGDTAPSPLARLRYFHESNWSMACFTWGHERYTPCVFFNGEQQGTLEQAIETCEPMLLGGLLGFARQ